MFRISSPFRSQSGSPQPSPHEILRPQEKETWIDPNIKKVSTGYVYCNGRHIQLGGGRHLYEVPIAGCFDEGQQIYVYYHLGNLRKKTFGYFAARGDGTHEFIEYGLD